MAALTHRLALALRALVGTFPADVTPTTAGGLLWGVSQTDSPVRNAGEFLQAYSTMPWLRATTHRIAEGVASTQWRVLAIRRRGRFQRLPGIQREPAPIRRKLLAEARQQGELVAVEDTPLLRVLHHGNPLLTGGNVRRVTQLHLDILGEAFWLKERNRAGVPEAVWPIPPSWVQQTPSAREPTYQVSFRGWQGHIPDTEVLWIRDPNPANPYGRGAGVVQSLADELEIDEYSAKRTKAFFYNQSIPPIVVAPPKGEQVWSPQQRTQLADSWNTEHRGFWRAFKAQFSRMPLEVHQLMHTFREQQLIELRQHERDTIVQVLGIPPEIVGILHNSNRATIDASTYLFACYVLVPRLELLRETYQERLVPEYDDRLIVDYDDPVPENTEQRLAAMQAAPWAATQDEWRAVQGLPPKDDGSGGVHVVPATLTSQARLDQMPDAVPVAMQGVEGALRRGVTPKAPLFVDVAPDDDFYGLVHQVADRLTPRMQRRFVEIISRAQDQMDLEALAAALRTRLDAAVFDTFPLTGITESLREAASETFRQGLTQAGTLAAEEMGTQFGLDVTFNQAHPLAVQFADEQSALLVTRIDETTRAGIRQAVSRSFAAIDRAPQTVDTVARQLRSSLGLLPRQEAGLATFADALRQAGRSPAEITRRVEARSRAYIRQRARLVARTEMLDAANEGQQQLWRQLGDAQPELRQRMRRFWITTPDDRLDEAVCEPIPFLNPDGVGLQEPFETPAGPIMRPTAHPGCRCATTLQIQDA